MASKIFGSSWFGSKTLTEEERRFLQHRVALFGFFGGLVLLSFLAYRMLALWITDHWDHVAPETLWYHFLSGISLWLLWALCRSGERSTRFIRGVEIGGLILGAYCLLMMGTYVPFHVRPDFILVLALGVLMFLRAVYVPSSPMRTLLLGLYIGVELVGATYYMGTKIDLSAWQAVNPVIASESSSSFAFAIALFSTAPWWVTIVTCCVMASRVVYGLRRDVREAKQLGQYKLVNKLGEGGMGMVFEATHALLRRPSAVKLLLPEKAGTHSIERFEREVRLTARLRDPHVVTVFDYGRTPDGIFYYAMELVDGATMLDIVQHTGPMETARAISLLHQAASALVEAHGIGLIHRDIKPANIMVHMPHRFGAVQEVAKVLDFGLVKEMETSDAGITQVGSIAGTPQYMAPEAIRSPEAIDSRSDLYSLGCVAFFLATGGHLFDGESAIDVCAKHLQEKAPLASERAGRAVPKDFEALIDLCLQKDPSDRPQSAMDIKTALEACDDYGGFTAMDAHEWWEEHDVLFKERGSSEQGFLTVDLGRALGTTESLPGSQG